MARPPSTPDNRGVNPRLDIGLRRAAALGMLALAFLGLGYTLAKEAPAPLALEARAAQLAFPLPGFEHALRDNFDEMRGKRRHQALDIMAPRGTPVHAVDDGRIAKLYRGPLAGLAIYQFDPAGTRVYFYAHLDRYRPGLEEGAEVKRGDLIGYVGSTGNAPDHAPHLHFALHETGGDTRWWKGKAVNPYELLRSPEARTALRP